MSEPVCDVCRQPIAVGQRYWQTAAAGGLRIYHESCAPPLSKPTYTLRVTGTISGTFAPAPVAKVIRCGRTDVATPVGTLTAGYGNVSSPVYTGCICLLDPWTARADGCPEHGLQPLTNARMTLTDTLRCAYKRGDLHKILPRMTADEVATAERGLPESMRAAVRAAWKALPR